MRVCFSSDPVDENSFRKSCYRDHPARSGEFGYEPRQPEATVFYDAVSRHLETFLVRHRQDGHGMPRFVGRLWTVKRLGEH